MAKGQLPYKVECQSTYVFFEVIAAFNVDRAAGHYALECSQANPRFHYRVTKGRKIILNIPAREG